MINRNVPQSIVSRPCAPTRRRRLRGKIPASSLRSEMRRHNEPEHRSHSTGVQRAVQPRKESRPVADGLSPRPDQLPFLSTAPVLPFLRMSPVLPFLSIVTWGIVVGRRTRVTASQKNMLHFPSYTPDSSFERTVTWQRRECVGTIEFCRSNAGAVHTCNRESRVQGGEVRGVARCKRCGTA